MQRMATLFSLACLAALTASPTFANSECTQGGMVRNIAVVYANPEQPLPCEVLYEKPSEGERMTLWRAENEAGYCEARAAEFTAKLEALGWQCATVGAADDPT